MTFPFRLIDLTHITDEQTATWDGTCGFNHKTSLDYQECQGPVKFRVMELQMNAGIGTHMDAPSHCKPDAASIHELVLDNLCMPCLVIDVSDRAHERYSVTVDDISSFESAFGIIPQDSCVMIKTGWERFWKYPERYRNNLVFPSVSPETAHMLIQRGVQMLGIDTLSSDRPEDGYNVHQIFLGNDGILIENVANLGKMPPVGAFVLALPLKAKDVTEAPARVVGMIKK